jgi:hypothetical protein
MKPVYSDRVVAFIDILGFGAIVQKLGEDSSLHAQIHYALSHIKLLKGYSLQAATAQSKLQVSVFSDSIVISGEADNVHGVIWSAIHLQCNLLVSGILVRGGIACGRTVHADDILYGEGMLDAYNLESKAAIYPRIVLAPKLINKIKSEYRDVFLAKDNDGLWFLDPFSMGLLPGDADALPKAVQDEVNRRMENGERGAALAAWLNGLPEVQAVLAAQFNGQPVNEVNLSQWRKRGYQNWLRWREARAMMAEATEPGAVPGAGAEPLRDQMANWVSV